MPEQSNSISKESLREDGRLMVEEPKQTTATQLERVKGGAKLLFHLITPSWRFRTTAPRKPLHKTAYLDGLRGFAAFLVYLQHHVQWVKFGGGILESAWGYNGNYYFLTFPGIRLLATGGHFSVAIFFIISGYVLANKPLKLIHAGEFTKLADNLSSALFRRWTRLYLPVFATTFVVLIYFQVFRIWVRSPGPDMLQKNLWEELKQFYALHRNFTFLFRDRGVPWIHYNYHLWSVPVDMKGSIIIYTVLLALGRARQNARFAVTIGLIIYFMWMVDGYYGSMFLSGMLLCDLDLLHESGEAPAILYKFKRYSTQIWYTLLVVAIYLSGVPNSDIGNSEPDILYKSPGWVWLSHLTPSACADPKWFFLLWASIFLFLAVGHLPWLKAFFETRFCQYLGRISYGLYLVHGPMLFVLADRLYVAVGIVFDPRKAEIPFWVDLFPLKNWGIYGYEFPFLVCQCIILPATFYVADMVTRLIDEPSVRFARWSYELTLPYKDSPAMDTRV